MGRSVDRIFVFLAMDDDGNEGIAGYPDEKRGYVPLITADRERAERLHAAAQEIATETGKEVRLVQYKIRRNMKRFSPAVKAKA